MAVAAATRDANAAQSFAATAEQMLADHDFAAITSADLAGVITAAARLYCAKAEAEGTLPPPLAADQITPTEVVVMVSEMMRAVNLNLFDLAMWYRRAR